MRQNNIVLIERLLLVKDYIINDRCFSGICDAVDNVGILNRHKWNKFETLDLKDYIKKNKPSFTNEYKEFTYNKFWCDNRYWWDRICDAPETKQIRIDYLTKLIDNIK